MASEEITGLALYAARRASGFAARGSAIFNGNIVAEELLNLAVQIQTLASGMPVRSNKPQTDVRQLVVGLADNPAAEVARQLEGLSSTIEAMRGDRTVIRVSGSLGCADDVGVIGIDGMQTLIRLACAELAKTDPAVPE